MCKGGRIWSLSAKICCPATIIYLSLQCGWSCTHRYLLNNHPFSGWSLRCRRSVLRVSHQTRGPCGLFHGGRHTCGNSVKKGRDMQKTANWMMGMAVPPSRPFSKWELSRGCSPGECDRRNAGYRGWFTWWRRFQKYIPPHSGPVISVYGKNMLFYIWICLIHLISGIIYYNRLPFWTECL